MSHERQLEPGVTAFSNPLEMAVIVGTSIGMRHELSGKR